MPATEQDAQVNNIPLPELLRPNSLGDFIGQKHLVGDGKIISLLINSAKTKGFFPSLIFWGPPGSGKTTLARIISQEIDSEFYEFSAVNASVKDIEKVIGVEKGSSKKSPPKEVVESQIEMNLATPGVSKSEKKSRPMIFLDEIHRFNKAQQDSLLPHVEKGTIILIGATTENPSFEVISPLLSRCRVVALKQHTKEDLNEILSRALDITARNISSEARDFLVQACNGDARVLLNVLDIALNLSTDAVLSVDTLELALQRRQLNFDLKGEEFYNTISALHKSIRGSDPNASIYWLARMLEAGQDPLYIGRRLLRMASEDIGLMDPQAMTVCLNAFRACEIMGMPECNLALAEAVVYLARAPKSNMLYIAYGRASEDVRVHGNLPVPMEIRNAPTKLMKDMGYGKDYKYEHSSEAKKTDQEYMPEELKGRAYF